MIPDTVPHPSCSFLADGGEMGALMRAFDWAATPLGAPAGWPDVLKTHLRTLLTCLVSCDHIPRRSMALFRAKAVLDELIAGLPPRSPHRLQQIA